MHYFNRSLKAAALPLAFYAAAGFLALLAILALAAAILLAWLTVAAPHWAAILAALCYASLALFIILISREMASRSKRPLEARGMMSGLGLLAAGVRRRPATSMALALGAGLILEHLERGRS